MILFPVSFIALTAQLFYRFCSLLTASHIWREGEERRRREEGEGERREKEGGGRRREEGEEEVEGIRGWRRRVEREGRGWSREEEEERRREEEEGRGEQGKKGTD